jgi:hypothetical protein
MTPNQSHVAGLELALNQLSEYSPTAHALAEYHLRPLIQQAKSAPAEPSREAVEVVGVRISTDGFGSYIADSAIGIGGPAPGEVRESLMTVSQHNRMMLAPPSPDAELVDLLRECRNDFAGVCMSRTLIQRIDAKLASLGVKP